MTSPANKLYVILLIACMAGYFWLYLGISNNRIGTETCTVCLIKHATKIPCPSCGSTRSVISLSQGNFLEAFNINPAGYIIAFIMLFAPLWISFDIITKRATLFKFYKTTEYYLKRPKFAIPLIFLVIINWVWNIAKDL